MCGFLKSWYNNTNDCVVTNMSHKTSLITSALLGVSLTALVHDPTSDRNALWERAAEEKRGRKEGDMERNQRKETRKGKKEIKEERKE